MCFAGSVLIVEQPYTWALSRPALLENCLHCCAVAADPVPCIQCTTVGAFFLLFFLLFKH